MGVRTAGVVTVGLARGLDPHVGDDRVAGPVRLRGRPRADAGTVDVAPVTAERPLVDLVGGHVGVDVGRAGVQRGGSGGAAPAVAGGVDEHADAAGEARGDQRGVHRLVVGVLVEVGVVLVEVGRVQRLPAHLERGVGQERLVGRGGVGGVADEAVHAGHTRGGGLGDLGELLGGRAHVAGPAEPAGVADVQVGVDVGDGVQLVQGVLDTTLVVRGCRRAGRLALVGDGVGQRVRLDDRGDPQVAVGAAAEQRGDRVDVLRLVLGQAGRGGRDLAVGGERRAVTAGEVVDHDLEQYRGGAARGLCLGLVELRLETQVGAVAGDGADVVHPDGGLVAGDLRLGRTGGPAVRGGLGVDLGDVVRVQVGRGPHVGVGDVGDRRTRGLAGGSDGDEHGRAEGGRCRGRSEAGERAGGMWHFHGPFGWGGS